MTLGRVMELYQAEQQGKQIMMRTSYSGYYSYYKEIKITECELKDLVLDERENISITFYIKMKKMSTGINYKNYGRT
jgi:hypothetical protein